MNKAMYKNHGFTIVELLIVIVVIGILAAIVVVAFNGIQESARLSRMQSDFNSIKKSVELYKAENGNWPICPTGNLGFTECYVDDIVSQLKATGVPTRTGDGTVRINYVAADQSTASPRWAVQFAKSDGSRCKMGHNMIGSWWSSAPNCW